MTFALIQLLINIAILAMLRIAWSISGKWEGGPRFVRFCRIVVVLVVLVTIYSAFRVLDLLTTPEVMG